MTIVGVIGSLMFAQNDTTVADTIPVTTAQVNTIPVQQYSTAVKGPKWEKKDLYVCNTSTDSTEYVFGDDMYQWEDGISRDIPWEQNIGKVVLLWGIDDEVKYNDFVSDVALFNEYTHGGVRVEQLGYEPQQGEFVVPVVHENIDGDFAWADMSVRVGVSGMFGIETVRIVDAKLRFDDLGLSNWEFHTHTTLHELGHLFGLQHTHGAEGQQTDSIMSYESDYNVNGYLPGDIAGLQEVFC